MYDGEIYKTKNLRNQSMMQMYPDPDDLARAQDSIDNRLKNYGKDLWVPTREEYLAQKEREEEVAKALAAGDTIPERTVASAKETKKVTTARTSTRKRGARKPKTVKPKSTSNGPASNAERSVRRRRK